MRTDGGGRVLFVSDVHLAPHLPELIDGFRRFVGYAAENAGALYVLGDLFDFWVGRKNARLPEYASVLDGFRHATSAGLPITFVPGNRDFQFDAAFGRTLGIEVTGDFHEVQLGGRRVMLHHGDLFCTRDRGYQALRRVVRNPVVRSVLRTMPLAASVALARIVRRKSDKAVARKPRAERALVDEAVVDWFRRGFDTVVCGHVHEAATRTITAGGVSGTLVTLGSFDEEGQFAAFDAQTSSITHERFETSTTPRDLVS
ncbi:MAG: UDP-2,3-diacylglucosamine diphosphatase [Planctomycetes bacterium]|nr:UDP-2,3-diacylglucosamine diphosphatase [Planctomycetota bacterium]MBI3848559.1 UDP-2,3-diacylglucosamine diphosphatase [Planctomycetota bacterium]